MSPKGSVSSASSSTSKTSSTTTSSISPAISRRPSGQPKSSRQQFSACGACRMRRVRCDLKDLAVASASPSTACSNCHERGLKCVDEFAEIKAVKLLRKGRRLQQVEAIYGKVSEVENDIGLHSFSRHPTIIPKLHPEFFGSPFWRWFCVQVPVLDADDFSTRYQAHESSSAHFGAEGEILARLISVWAVSYGLDERGVAMTEDPYEMSEKQKRDQKDRVLAMIREIFELIDQHALLRRPTWDGLRVLLLILPFLEEHPALEKLSFYHATLNQAHTLCALTPSCSTGQRDDIVTRARLYWYSHLHEGITTALRGGRLALSSEDLKAFQHTLQYDSTGSGSTMNMISRLFSVPLRLNSICRRVHSHLTGTAAQRHVGHAMSLDFDIIRDVWESLDRCWEDLDHLRNNSSDPQHIQDIERYAAAWKICIFECHNIIRETLQEIHTRSSQGSNPTLKGSCSQQSSPSSGSTPSTILVEHAHQMAIRKCFRLLPLIVEILKTHSGSSDEAVGSGLFKWDANLVRDGCFFAGILAANYDEATHRRYLTDDGLHPELDLPVYGQFNGDDGVAAALGALRDMRWIMSLSEERQNQIHAMYENRHRHRFQVHQGQSRTIEMNYSYSPNSAPPHGFQCPPKVVVHPAGNDRPQLPPLILSESTRQVHSAPSTALSTSTDSSGWPTYTPPSTGGSVPGPSVVPHSPFPSPHAYKPDASGEDAGYYHIPSDVPQFSFNPPVIPSMAPPLMSDPLVVSVPTYHAQHRTSNPTMHVSPGSNYMDVGVHFSSNSTLIRQSPTNDARACPPFTEDNCGYYQ